MRIYGLFVVYRYVCIDVIITNSITVVFIQTCLQSYSALHRRSYMFELASSILTYYLIRQVYYIGF